VTPLENFTGYLLDDAQQINKKLHLFLDANPEKTIVIMPESTFPAPINDYPEVIKLWQENVLSRNLILLIGAHKLQDNKLYNTLYCIDAFKVIQDYDKKILMPFTEYIPNFLPTFYKKNKNNNKGLKNIFIKDKREFTSSPNSTDTKVINCFIPYICSEFYFGPIKQKTQETILCVVNDSWFSTNYLKNLMFLFAQYTAMETEQTIIYAGHYAGLLIKKNGAFINLA